MKDFIYTGTQPFNLTHRFKDADGKFKTSDIQLAKGDVISIDESYPIVKSLVSRGLLIEKTDKPIKEFSKK